MLIGKQSAEISGIETGKRFQPSIGPARVPLTYQFSRRHYQPVTSEAASYLASLGEGGGGWGQEAPTFRNFSLFQVLHVLFFIFI